MQPTIDVVHRSYTHSCTHLKQTNLTCKMEEEDHRDDESIDGDEEVDGNSKNRVSKEITELYYFVLVLALNQVTTKYDGLRAEEQAAKMVKLSLEWVDLLRTDFGMITKKLMGKGGVTEDQIRATINKDTGKNMLKKAKIVVSVINNHMSSYWKEPEESASGKGREGTSFCLLIPFCL
jgi:phosphoribosyl-ATP pyrophosphohydrolase